MTKLSAAGISLEGYGMIGYRLAAGGCCALDCRQTDTINIGIKMGANLWKTKGIDVFCKDNRKAPLVFSALLSLTDVRHRTSSIHPTMTAEQIRSLSHQIHERVVGHRRHLHANPELSFQEYATAAFVRSVLDEMQIPHTTICETGVVAMIQGEKPSDHVVALRADMDALPITESRQTDYISRVPGVMHACGHDAHTSSLLGAAFILNSLKNSFGGTVKLIFQPGEEKLPGGASLMIREGVLENPVPAAVIGQHVMPQLPAGKIAIRKGRHMASMDEITMTIHGRGGHGAQPHQNIDPVIITAHILVALQQIVSRIADPKMPSVLSFGKVIADGAINVIPDSVFVQGTFRCFDEAWRTKAHEKLKTMAEGMAASMGGSCTVDIVRGYPALNNAEWLTEQVVEWAGAYLGRDQVVEAELWMAAEDFAYYAQHADACFYLLGTGNIEKGITASLHTPGFDIDESALADSPGLMAWLAIKSLGN
jgi:amidohydrolase